ncbi:MAG TPA: TolC family protein [Gemmatimonadaceae bacterium]|nr:TolC family protein [Gemmatimonadaceae bacterium]
MHTQALIGAFVLLWGASAGAQQPADHAAPPPLRLTRQQAVAQALDHNPQLAAVREQVAQAQARHAEATALPDPAFGANIDNETGFLQPHTAETKELALGFTIPFPTKLMLAGRAAGRDVEAAQFGYTQSRQFIASQTVQAYDAVLVALQHGTDLTQGKQLAQDFLQKTQARFQGGTAARIDVIKAEVAVAQAENDLIANQRDVANGRAALNRLMGRGLGTTLQLADTLAPPDTLPPLAPLEQLALRSRPEVRSMEAEQQGAHAAASLAGQYWLPDLSITFTKDFAPGQASVPFSTDLGFSLPLFFWQHQHGQVAEAHHHELELAASSRDLSAQVAQDVRDAYAAASTALRQVVYLRDQLLPEARRAYQIVSASYGLGGSSALDVLDAQRTLLDAESQYAEALGAANDAHAQLELAVGASLDSASSGDPHEH